MTWPILDTCTDTAGVLATAHTADSGDSLILFPVGFQPNSPKIFTSFGGILANENSFGRSGIRWSTIAPQAAVSASATVRLDSLSQTTMAGPMVRLDPSTGAGYLGVYRGAGVDRWEIYRMATGSTGALTSLGGTTVATGMVNGSTPIIKLTATNSSDLATVTLVLNVAGTDVLTVTDAAAGRITSAGYVGFWWDTTNTEVGAFLDRMASATPTTAATAITLTGPTTGTAGTASTNFTVGADGTITGTVVVTPNDSSGGGTFAPTSVSISSGTPTGTFTYTAASAGTKTIAVTNSGSLTNPTAISFVASSGTVAPTIITAPAIIGTPQVGVASSYTAGTYGGSTATLTRQWTLDGAAISGATGATYTPVSGDATHLLRVVETATNSAGNSGPNTSASKTVGAAAGAVSVVVTLSDAAGAPLASLTGIKGAVFDSFDLAALGSPFYSFSGATTNSSGVLTVAATGSTKAAGGIGYLVIGNPDGNPATVFSGTHGPVTFS